jgi:hypothetical protein
LVFAARALGYGCCFTGGPLPPNRPQPIVKEPPAAWFALPGISVPPGRLFSSPVVPSIKLDLDPESPNFVATVSKNRQSCPERALDLARCGGRPLSDAT